MEAVMKSKRMNVEMTPNGDWSKLPLFDRTGWKQVRFADVVHRADGRYDRASANLDIQRWVAGEHIDEGDLHIRRESFTDDALFPPTFRFTFKAGHVLLHSRNPKKVAMAHFDGITGEKLFVLKPKDENVLLKDFLPFVLLSDHFQKWAIENSSGSVNKFLNWSALERYSFALPPHAQQRQIADLLWAVDEVMNKYLLRDESLKAYQSRAEHHFMNGIADLEAHIANRTNVELSGWKILSGQELLDRDILAALQDGNHGGQYPKKEEFTKEGTPYVAASHISVEGEINFSECPCLSEDVKKRLRIPSAKGGDVLLTHNASIGRVAIIPVDVAEVVASTSTTYYRTNPVALSNQYLAAFLKSELFQQQLRRVMKQSTRDQVPITAQKKLMFVVPPKAIQESFVQEAEQFMQLNHLSKLNRFRLDVLRSSLLNSFA